MTTSYLWICLDSCQGIHVNSNCGLEKQLKQGEQCHPFSWSQLKYIQKVSFKNGHWTYVIDHGTYVLFLKSFLIGAYNMQQYRECVNWLHLIMITSMLVHIYQHSNFFNEVDQWEITFQNPKRKHPYIGAQNRIDLFRFGHICQDNSGNQIM